MLIFTVKFDCRRNNLYDLYDLYLLLYGGVCVSKIFGMDLGLASVFALKNGFFACKYEFCI